MPAYNSRFNKEEVNVVGQIPILPLGTRFRGPAPPTPKDKKDIIDEAIRYFRANVLMASIDLKGDADNLLIYLTLCISEMISKFTQTNGYPAEGAKIPKIQEEFLLAKFCLPGGKRFPDKLTNFIKQPNNPGDQATQKSFLGQCRKELFTRMFKILYPDGKTPNRLWFGFYRRKFLNMALPVSGAAIWS